MEEPRYPIGIQDFEEIRSLNALYVDKTALIHRLTHSCKYVFLSRPRRFGKSLLTSTLHYYFEGRSDLFSGLAMEELEKEWIEYPVLHFDLSTVKGKPKNEMIESIALQLSEYEERYNVNKTASALGDRLNTLIRKAYEATNQKAVLLIDEYDAPILDVLHDDGKREDIRMILSEFYSPLKACDKYLRFVFLTGISMFSQLSIFSELNNLKIISRRKEYNALCGITKKELLDNFQYGINKFAESLKCSKEAVVEKLTDCYDGYHFSEDSEGIFNPFSILNAIEDTTLDSYWFRSGTPRFLIEMLKKYRQEGKFDIDMLDSINSVSPAKFESPLESQSGPLSLLYQAGYLTIKDYDPEARVFFLGIPNSEVRVGLLQNLLPIYSGNSDYDVENTVSLASVALKKGDLEKAMTLLKSMLASLPYMRGDKDILADAEKTEAYYHRIFFFFFRMLHNEVNAEVRSSKGAADITILSPKYIYIVEIKINGSADAALRQIQEKGYADPFLADKRELTKVGVNFDTQERNITEWKSE
jgi:hypothetical protein